MDEQITAAPFGKVGPIEFSKNYEYAFYSRAHNKYPIAFDKVNIHLWETWRSENGKINCGYPGFFWNSP